MPSRTRTSITAQHKDGDRFLARGVRIVYQDTDLLVVDKPTGLVTADPTRKPGDPGYDQRPAHTLTLFDLVKRYIREHAATALPPQSRRRTARPGEEGANPSRHSSRTPRAWVIHRLDKEASGLVVFALSEAAFLWLKEDFKSKRVHRLYHALAEGQVGPVGHSGTRQSFMRDEREPPPRAGSPRAAHAHDDPRRGKLAVTHYRVIATGNGRTLLHVRLETGRKNQIRVHFAEMGFPLVGDRRFGARTDPISRLGLHAAELGFTHAGTGTPMRFHSPPPVSFARAAGLSKADAAPPSPAFAHSHGDDVDADSHNGPDRHEQPSTRNATTPAPQSNADTSWEKVADWYDHLQDDAGNDHYRMVILPGALRLLEPRAGERLLDAACGQGVLARRLGELGVAADGVEASASLVEAAQRRDLHGNVRFLVGDARRLDTLGLSPGYDAAACIMALANIDPLAPVFHGVASLLRNGGRFVAVIAHPAFRSPRQTAWGWDRHGDVWRQYRRIDGYLSLGQVEIDMHPGRSHARSSSSRRAGTARRRTGPPLSPGADDDAPVTTLTFHRPIQAYVRALADAGLLIDRLEEWPSLRMASSGPRAPEENRARREIPMFLGLRAIKAR